MRHKIKMPKVADSVDEVVVLEWQIEVGDQVLEGETLLRVETDKVDMDVPTPLSGTLVEILVQEEAEVATGTAICVIES